jgi:glycosyltransferase involved in cell wall biosynthesis
LENKIKVNQNLKITLLTTSFPRFQDDSAGVFIYKSATHLSAINCSVNVVAPHDINVQPQEIPKKLAIHHFKYFYPLRFQSFAYKGGMANRIKNNWLRVLQFPFFMICFFLKAFRISKDSDIIHSYWSVAGLIALITKFFRSSPVIFTIWGSDIFFTKIPVISFFYKIFLRQADAIVCESQDFKNQLNDFGVPEGIISIIGNGIDYNYFKPGDKIKCRRNLGLPKEKLIIMAVGNLILLKGHRFLIEAIPELISNHSNLHFIFVGDGEYRSHLENQVTKLNILNNVQFVGQQDVSQIPNWLISADIFVHPSLSEGTPNSVIEAMACKLPVIATSVGDIPNIIEDGKDGFLIPPRDSRQLASKLNSLIQNEKLREQFGLNGLQKVQSKFGSWETQTKILMNLYQEVRSNCT